MDYTEFERNGFVKYAISIKNMKECFCSHGAVLTLPSNVINKELVCNNGGKRMNCKIS